MIRLFAAIPAPPEIAEGLKRRQQGLPGARWRPAEHLHVTLRFFGEVSEPVAADLDAELATIPGAPFFPSLSTKMDIWIMMLKAEAIPPQTPSTEPKMRGSKMTSYTPSSPTLGFFASLAISPALLPALEGLKSFNVELHSTP